MPESTVTRIYLATLRAGSDLNGVMFRTTHHATGTHYLLHVLRSTIALPRITIVELRRYYYIVQVYLHTHLECLAEGEGAISR